MLLVHALMRADDAGRLGEVTAGRVRPHAVAAGGLAAAVSEAPDHDLTEDDAVAHLDLLTALAADVPVLPMALGTSAPDEDAVREEILTPLADQLEHALAAVAHLVELRLTLTFDADALVADVARADPEIARLAARTRPAGTGLDERISLGQFIAGRVAEEQQALAEQWTTELAGVAERSVVLGVDEQVRREAHLVRRDRIADADAAVERLRQQVDGRAAVEWVGPLPVYSFLDEGPPAKPEPAPPSRWGW